MPITVVASPVRLQWSHFREVDTLTNNEDAHIDPAYDIENRPVRRVGDHFELAETLTVTVTPRARVLRRASQTDRLLAHEQGHYDLGILAGRALARDLAALRAPSFEALRTALRDAHTLHTRTRLGPIQERYDADTRHGLDAGEQQRWEGLISACLSSASCGQISGFVL